MIKLISKIILIPFTPMILITDLIYSILNKIKSIAYPEKYYVMEKKWADRTCITGSGNDVRNIRKSENYGRYLLQGEILFKLQWTEGIWFPDGKYAGTLVGLNDRSLDLVEIL